MDPITTAIVAALPALATGIVKTGVSDAYDALKAIIKRKWGDESKVAKSVDALEAASDSKIRAVELSESFRAINAGQDPEVMHALAILVDVLKKEGIGGSAVEKINVNIDGPVGTSIVGENVNIGSMTSGAPSQTKN